MTRKAPLDRFLDGCAEAHGTRAGTAETSYYPALKAALDEVGGGLKPKVFALHHPSGKAAGIPDFGLFEAAARRGAKATDAPEWRAGVQPARGVVEVKGVAQGIDALATGAQVAKYATEYGLVLATNLRQFRLLGGGGQVLERFDLAADEGAFWKLAHGSRPDTLRTRFGDFLQRCLLTRAPLAKPQDLAFFLASYARDALALLTEKASLPALKTLRDNLEKGLGIAFDKKDGERLFRSTLVQTLFYGLFSAWVTHVQDKPGEAFSWKQADWSLHVPVMQLLFQQVASPQALAPLGIAPLLDAAQAALARVDQAAFFTAFEEASAIQHFYEPFLEFFDPDLRKQLGVWYTPPEIVRYMVERVDRVLRSELGVADGLADESVWVLDPCCGTGSYLVAVLARIRETLAARGMGDLLAEKLRQAATTRVVGFEIMPAPFVIAHWQVGEALRKVQAHLSPGERAAIYLTNALTGWDADEKVGSLEGAFDALANERADARTVKQTRPILVVIGNPPYNAFAGTSPESERGLVEPYKEGLISNWGVKKFNLDDLYVRFFRIAERRVAEATGRGVVCFISNFSWLSGASYVVMRQRLLEAFDAIWIDNLNGDSRETGKLTPDGRPDPSVFSTPMSREGIRVGTAVATLVRQGDQPPNLAIVRARMFWGEQKRADVLASLDETATGYEKVTVSNATRFVLRHGSADAGYESWTTVRHIASDPPLNGPVERRALALIDFSRKTLSERMRAYFDPTKFDDEAVRHLHPGLLMVGNGIDGPTDRVHLVRRQRFDAERIVRFPWKPYDVRYCYLDSIAPLFSRPNVPLQKIGAIAGQSFFVTRDDSDTPDEGPPAYLIPCICDYDFLRGHARLFPLVLPRSPSNGPSDGANQLSLSYDAAIDLRPNLSPAALAWASALTLLPDVETSRLVWHHAVAVTYSPAYLAENAAGIRQGWPRIPLPNDAALLRVSAALGARLALLLDSDTPVPGVTAGAIEPALAPIGVPTTRPGAERDWRLTGWGNRTDKGVTMPGRGQSTLRPYAPAEAATAEHAEKLGAQTRDVGMSGASFWANIPEQVWETHIGGYQVLKKWLSYRDGSILDRALTAEEVGHVQGVARRLAAILLMGPELDASFRACAAAHVPLPTGGS